MKRKKSVITKGNLEAEHINLTPIMNMFVMLIPFLLLSAAFIKFAAIDAPVPKAVAKAATSAKKGKQPVNLHIFAYGDKLDVEVESRGTTKKTIPNVEGAYDLKTLHDHLISIKQNHPSLFRLDLHPADTVKYDDIIQIMDSSRTLSQEDPEILLKDPETGKEFRLNLLFPDVVLTDISA